MNGPRSPYEFAPRKVEKPWGWELIWAEAETYVGKLLFIRAREALSLQYHEAKDESWLVHEGRATLEIGEVGGGLETMEIEPGVAFRLRPGTVHRLSSRSLLRTSTTSCGSRIATAGKGPRRPDDRSRGRFVRDARRLRR